jgi:hypothetical protein
VAIDTDCISYAHGHDSPLFAKISLDGRRVDFETICMERPYFADRGSSLEKLSFVKKNINNLFKKAIYKTRYKYFRSGIIYVQN